MARTKAEPTPSVHAIKAARSASSCETCKRGIAEGELMLSEAYVLDDGPGARSVKNARNRRARDPLGDSDRRYNDDSANPDLGARFHHLECAAQQLPYILRQALASPSVELEPVRTLLIPERGGVELAIERALSAVDVAEEAPETREEYRRFIERLRADGDDSSLEVFADWLQNHGDPRGELAALQRRRAAASTPELVALEKKLLAAHRDRFVPDRFEGELSWRSGFVHRLTLTTTTSLDRSTLARAFTHPSFRLLRELAVRVERLVIGPNLPALPSTLRALELGRAPATPSEYYDTGVGDVAEVVAGAAQLQRLCLSVACPLALRSGSLSELEVHCTDANQEQALAAYNGARSTLVSRIPQLAAKSLPKLRTLRLRVAVGLEDVLRTLIKHELFPQLHTLALHGDLTPRSVEALEKNSGALQVLDLRDCSKLSSADFERLERLVPTVIREEVVPVVEKKTISTEWRVRHTRKPEWGIGTVVSEGDEGLEVEFPNAGRKQVRNVELLEDVSEP